MAGNLFKKYHAFIKLIRPKTLLWFCVSTCYGFASVILNSAPPLHFVFLVLTIVFANIGAIIVNDIGDIEVDSKSSELSKRTRPLVTGEIKKGEAIILAVTFFLLSILTSFFYGLSAIIFSIVIIILALSYSLPPFKFCARPYSSILYWIVLCALCYLLMVLSLENINNGFIVINQGKLLDSKPGTIFIIGIILFMGIAEIIAKDLRDFINDAEGGRNTYVYFVGVEIATKVLIFFAWFGYILWIESLYLRGMFPTSLSAWLCAFVGFFWCVRVHLYSLRLMKKYEQTVAIKIHQEWTYAYALMQFLTFASYYYK